MLLTFPKVHSSPLAEVWAQLTFSLESETGVSVDGMQKLVKALSRHNNVRRCFSDFQNVIGKRFIKSPHKGSPG